MSGAHGLQTYAIFDDEVIGITKGAKTGTLFGASSEKVHMIASHHSIGEVAKSISQLSLLSSQQSVPLFWTPRT